MKKLSFLLIPLCAFLAPAAYAQAVTFQQEQQSVQQQQRAVQTQEVAIQQASQQSLQSLMQTVQQWMQTVQQQENANQQRLNTPALAKNMQQNQTLFQQDQQSIQTDEQALQQTLNQLPQTVQMIMQAAQQQIQTDQQAIQQDLNSQDFGDIAGLESAIQQILTQETANIQTAMQQGQTVFQQYQTTIGTVLTAQAAIGGSGSPPPPAAVNGACGSSSGQSFSSAPSANLCSTGSASSVTGAGPFAWSCSGSNGGTNASCQASLTPPTPVAVNGACGASNGQSFSSAPSANLCSTGTATSVTGSGPFAWNCAGGNGGTNASCQASLTPPTQTTVNGACGQALGQPTASAPTTNLCSAGTASSVNNSGSNFLWSCAGSGGGNTAQCSAPVRQTVAAVNGACGSSNGQSFSSTPSANLCSTGSASSVTGSGPFAWSCAGSNGGSNASCQARLTPPAPVAVNGACGASNGQSFSSAPLANLCTTGTASSVTGSGPFAWSCAGSNGGSNASCQATLTPAAPVEVNGACGSSNGQSFSAAPSSNLCSTGTASSVSGSGPFAWSCTGTNGGTNASCTASLAASVVNGVCGPANGTSVPSAPTANLCSAGTASAISGSGPWSWLCDGSGGGSNATCAAAVSTGSAFYVSPTGSDSNNGTSPSTPFATFAMAQQAMEDSSEVKTTYIMGGTYNITSPISLNAPQDNGQSWLGYPGQTPILNNAGGVEAAIMISPTSGYTNNITIRFLTIENFPTGIDAQASSGDFIDSNTILNSSSPDTNHAAIFLHWNFSNAEISHNYINQNKGPGIALASGSVSEVNSNVHIEYNAVYNTNTSLSDSGAIYVMDRGHQSVGQTINNNIVGNYGTSGGTKAIYLDDETSNITVTNNITYGPGQYGIQIHGGNNVVAKNNIFDLTDAQALGLYQDDVGSGFPNYGMTGNVFTGNIIYAGGSPTRLWDYINQSGGTIALPADHTNLYYAANASYVTANSTGTIIDSQPFFGDPGFADAAENNYTLTSTSAAVQLINFIPIDVSTVGPVSP